ncbi:hypothetical protein BV25DRAFT_1842674 [Artomyces pyxidatus]|uniref:Uncharacterized protein n=1 Tax=Artomyces pyxidatus TaxID=48021 RepID=A0ACB8SHH9_9AGAM|nr:hypothetical protein BV25DRAFT_1842674 [Artomyces pyxidatus]
MAEHGQLPSTFELRAAILDSFATGIHTDIPSIRAQVLQAHPRWRRIRNLLNTPNLPPVLPVPTNDHPPADDASVIVICADIKGRPPFQNRDNLQAHLRTHSVPITQLTSSLSTIMLGLLHDANAYCFREVYDRDPSVHTWYYAWYCAATMSVSADQPVNSIATFFQKEQLPSIRGPVVVIKSGPIDYATSWSSCSSLSAEHLARTIWWYFKSGNSVQDVFGEREFMRYLLAVYV